MTPTPEAVTTALDWSHGAVALLAVGVRELAAAIVQAVRQRRFDNGNGHDRRRPAGPAVDVAAIEWRARTTEQIAALTRSMAATRTDIHDIREKDLQPLVLRLGLLTKDVEILQKRCPLLEEHRHQ